MTGFERETMRLYPPEGQYEEKIQRLITRWKFALVEQKISWCFPPRKIEVLEYSNLIGKLVEVRVYILSTTDGGDMRYGQLF